MIFNNNMPLTIKWDIGAGVNQEQGGLMQVPLS